MFCKIALMSLLTTCCLLNGSVKPALSQSVSPELASPKLASPELASPELASPELASPELASPELASPELASPEPNRINSFPTIPLITPELERTLSSSAKVLFAVVRYDGKLIRSFGASSSQKTDGTQGYYQVIFGRNVTSCAYTATLGRTDSQGVDPPGFITVVGRFNNKNGVFISTHNKIGTLADRSFHLVVTCPN
ncbi:hypothetical protein [Nostoc sp. WHI]|uniref:hypothetical protein n=1 Tax=Nostoc sp. WHI TaxID=2650611 RepID=UPI001E5E2315|nr:hypothetical protein [Nostoc sp. WHI]